MDEHVLYLLLYSIVSSNSKMTAQGSACSPKSLLSSSMRWKNERPRNNEPYKPTEVEHVANILTHGVIYQLIFSHSVNTLSLNKTFWPTFNDITEQMIVSFNS